MSHYYTSHKNLDYANKNNTYISIFIFITSCQQNSTQTELNNSILLDIDFDDSNLIHVKDFIDQVTFGSIRNQ